MMKSSHYLCQRVARRSYRVARRNMEERASVSEVEGLETSGVVGRSFTAGDDTPAHERKDIRIWMDGAFDMMHFGHMNAFRQGRALGT